MKKLNLDQFAAKRGLEEIRKETPHGVTTNVSAWNTETLPDDEITVLIRYGDKDYPVTLGYHSEGEWCVAEGFTCEYPVTGWMHLHDAARILDAATQTNALTH